MTATLEDPRLSKLDRRHHHFVHVIHPWHLHSLYQIPEFKSAFEQGRVICEEGSNHLYSGPIAKVWCSADESGQLLSEWGYDVPPGVVKCARCQGPNVNGSAVFCSYCGAAYPTRSFNATDETTESV